MYRARVLGEFPDQSELNVYSLAWIETASREPEPQPNDSVVRKITREPCRLRSAAADPSTGKKEALPARLHPAKTSPERYASISHAASFGISNGISCPQGRNTVRAPGVVGNT